LSLSTLAAAPGPMPSRTGGNVHAIGLQVPAGKAIIEGRGKAEIVPAARARIVK
jgi:hypothetical protein